MTKSFVVVVSGVTAGGKTTLINELHKEFIDSKVISFDDYSIDALPSAPPIETPVQEAVNQYDLSPLMKDFLSAKDTFSFIFIDFPFGYKHTMLEPYITKTVYVKTPLDIVFARLIVRDYYNKSAEEILNWAQLYLDSARPIFIDHEHFVSEDADLILDGTLPLVEQLKLVKKALQLKN
ncbi:adenylyl-sulfate kinase [Carnobacterium sp.]|uniref:adenylyl-sulfate kinase n=1 Tax=Carnobacterium sp. TaxID=48221 RepID=UPI0028B255DF|nr:adenylyl-sulfate kinase [Carnobacterium sp.]